MKVKLLTPVTLEGSNIPAGEIIELSELSAKALVKEGGAEEVLPTAEEAAAAAEDAQDKADQEALVKAEEEEKAKLAEEQKKLEEAAAALAKVKKALDRFTKDELAQKAKEFGVEYAFDAHKPAIIEAIVAAGVAAKIIG